MKKLLLAIIIIILGTFFYRYIYGYKYQKLVNNIILYQADINLLSNNGVHRIDSTTINLDTYFQIFDKLKIEPNFKLNYYYQSNYLEGFPIFLALKQKESLDSILLRFKEYQPPEIFMGDSIDGKTIISNEFYNYATTELNPMPHIVVEDSKMGYFQYLIFYLIGDRFCLFWHATRKDILCTKSYLLIKVKDLAAKDESNNFSKVQKRRSKRIFPQPEIKLEKDNCSIELVEFDERYGFSKSKYFINRQFPHSIKLITTRVIVPYSSNIIIK